MRARIFMVLTSVCVGFLHAQMPAHDPERQAAAGRMLSAMKFEQTLKTNRGDPQALVVGARSDCARDQVSAAVCAERVMKAERLASLAAVTRDAAIPDILAAAQVAYANHLSANEMDQITAFYLGPAGQKLLTEQPAIDVDLRAAQGRIMLKWLATAAEKEAN